MCFNCTIFQKKFSHKSHLTHHMATVHSEPCGQKTKHICTQCGKCFGSNSVLKKHKVLHSNQRLHHYTFCSKAFFRCLF